MRTLGAEQRAIVAFPAVIDGRPKYVQVQLRWEGPERRRVTSFLGFMVDAGFLDREAGQYWRSGGTVASLEVAGDATCNGSE